MQLRLNIGATNSPVFTVYEKTYSPVFTNVFSWSTI